MKHLLLLILTFNFFIFSTNAEIVSEDIEDAYVQKILDSGDTSALQKLINEGLDVNSRDAQGDTMLFYLLTHYADFDMAKTLINAGADVNLPSNNGLTPLLVATALAGELQKQKIATEPENVTQEIKNAKLKEQTEFLMARSQKLLQLLIDSGADVNQETPRGTPLMSAATSELNLPIAETLLKAGAKVNLQDRFGRTALFYAAAFGCDSMTTFLLKAGADINVLDIDGKSYMDVSAEDITKNY